MSLNQKDIEKIEAYLEGALSSEDTNAFERLMQSDEEFSLEVRKYQEIQKVLSDREAVELKEKLIHIGAKIKAEGPTVFSRTAYWYTAASVTLLIGSFLTWQSLRIDPDALYQEYFSPYPAETVRGEQPNETWERVMLKYRVGDFSKVIEDIKSIDAPDDLQKLYLGNCYLQIDDTSNGLQTFQAIDPEGQHGKNATWFIALCYLKMGDIEIARTYLARISEGDSIHKKNALKLLQEL